ncbi:hypothetical protein [Mucilaginibacter pedocola]|uniref:Uncharacterized protein n=1 Tax=Mucilaginibacter pedocola TaxID=1792845 RepID=A0A1S9PGB3_9SPHI|nr:hypothetical protein [Mucilaginibacter pedocola]OOQ60004.1 hypothetical protein BC343_27120 [Mucilaginibacter pedocola]
MSDTTADYSSYSLHVVLATFPQGQETNFHRSVKDDFYGRYREESVKFFNKSEDEQEHYKKNHVPIFYQPLSYFILGNYDIAYIALIDNFKFAQRLFEPRSAKLRNKHGRNVFGTHTFQTFTGIARENDQKLTDFFYDHLKPEDPVRKFFCGISNLKLNNEILIGNGAVFLEAVNRKIAQLISLYNEKNNCSVEYLRTHSFSWFEISLLLFADSPDDISGLLQSIRRLTLADLEEDTSELISNSLYPLFFPDSRKIDFLDANIFADTHTYFGLHSDLADDPHYLAQLKQSEQKLRTALEWRVKPGHLHLLNSLFKSDELGKELFGELEQFLMLGSSDYCLTTHFEDPVKNIKLIKLIMNEDTQLFQHVSKVKTRVYFERKNPTYGDEFPKKSMQEIMPMFAETINAVRKIDDQLKALKISRQIRSKILKLFSNYNNGIQDLILFPYLMDFTIFVDQLKTAIRESYNAFQNRMTYPETYKGFEGYHILEDLLMKMITIFQEGFSIRMLNNYQFEDINDFDLDFNSSIQQLLSTYSVLAYEMGNLIYDPKYSYGPIVQISMKDTVSNNNSINYYINHLTSPEFVFATFSKEILNTVIFEDQHLKDIYLKFEKDKAELYRFNAVLRDMEQRKLINFQYFINDTMRFAWTYRADFELFYYWFWTYNFQNSSLYDELGMLSELHFQKELFRILFIRRLFNKVGEDMPALTCPLPELDAYWDRYYQQIDTSVRQFIDFLDRQKISFELMNYLQSRLNDMMRRSDRECDIPEMDHEAAFHFTERLKGKYELDIMPQTYANLIAKRHYAFERLSAGMTAESGVPKNSLLYLEWYMWDHLKNIFRMNGSSIDMLRRNWQTGRPMSAFMQSTESNNLYTVDQTGGLFFDSTDKQGRYLKMSTRVLTDLWHYALVRKKGFIQSKFNVKIPKHDRGD